MRNKAVDLETLAKGLDISPTMYKYAVDRYKGIAAYLARKGIEADFGPQGSFRTGTVVRPIREGKESDYDIDVVCTLTYDKRKISPDRVKNIVGDALREDETYRQKLKPEDNRCWTLEYAEVVDGIGFNMDVVPAVKEEDARKNRLLLSGVNMRYAQEAIAITDKYNYQYKYLSSNPSGFGLWFDGINERFQKINLQERKAKVFYENRTLFSAEASVDDVPDYYVRSILQRIIQLLKRHRDLHYQTNKSLQKFKPASVIITSLAAKIATGSDATSIEELLRFIVRGLNEYASLLKGMKPKGSFIGEKRDFIEKKEGKWRIPNPVDPEDNYADSWTDETANAFFQWVKTVAADLAEPESTNELRYITGLQTSFGKDYVNKKLGIKPSTASATSTKVIRPTKPWGNNDEC